MDVSGLPQNGAYASPVAHAPAQTLPASSRVAEAGDTGKTGADARYLSRQDDNVALARQAMDSKATGHAGPPPSFEVSLLEVTSDLKQVIARMEAARSHERDAAAVQPAFSAPAAAPAVEAPEKATAAPAAREPTGEAVAPPAPYDEEASAAA